MIRFSICFIALGVAAQCALAAPWPTYSKHATHRMRDLPKGLVVVSFHPESKFEIFNTGIDHPLTSRAKGASIHDAATSFLESCLGAGSLSIKSSFEGQLADHVFVSQQFHGIPVANAIANVALNKAGRVVSFGSSFVNSRVPTVPKSAALLLEEEAVTKAAQSVVRSIARSGVPRLRISEVKGPRMM